MRTILSQTDWSRLHGDSSINDKCDYLTTAIKTAASESIPHKTALIRPADKTWVNGHIRKLIRQRKRIYRKALQTNNEIIWAKFRKKRNIVTSEIKKAKQNYNDDLSHKLRSNSTDTKLFWKISKQLFKQYPEIATNLRI